MWLRFNEVLRCPFCHGKLDLVEIEKSKVAIEKNDYESAEKNNISTDRLNEYIDAGILLCPECKYWFPLMYGLPVLLPYETPITMEFTSRYKKYIGKISKKYKIATDTPKSGEQFVRKSFSKEWLEYNYDGIIWGWTYDDREETFLIEMGVNEPETPGLKFLEVGCGLGITTGFAQKNYQCDAVGADLSLAVLRASNQYRKNPFLHFVQASLFRLPFKNNHFDLVYSHGVLHHTYSTREALKSICSFCKDDGWVYIWVYGKAGLTESWDRRLGHYAEVALRPALSRIPAPIATTCLAPIALGYIFFNSILRRNNPTLQAYDFKRALHAARDRFTPRFAFRHNHEEVESWFREFGFGNVQRVDWQNVPASGRPLFRQAVGVRGQRK